MDHEKSIREQGRFAQRLAEDIRALLGAVPFGAEVYRSRYALERLARPVVAVTGAEGVGKSTLVRALDEVGVSPVEWWEVAPSAGPLNGRAEVFVLVTSAVQPLPLGDLTLLHGLAESAPDLALRVVLTRADELATDELPAVQERVRKLLAEALHGRTISFAAVSGRTGAGISTLREELLEALFLVQRDRLLEEVAGWGAALADLHALLEMRELAAVKPETIERLRTRLDGLLVEEGARIRGQLTGVVEQFVRGKEAALPRSQRQLTNALREAFVAKLRQEVEGIQPRLNQELAEALRGDVDTATTLALTNRFE
ncbi:MAG TPA: GTPase domain-containing protein, partial [Hyalangium sp.]|nr:GTPase domain-containing protein [Hyalangium sp.]